MKSFRIPASAAELLESSDALSLTVEQNVALVDLSSDAVQEFADGTEMTRMHSMLTTFCGARVMLNETVAVLQDSYMIW